MHDTSSSFMIVFWLIYLAILIPIFIGYWKMFVKAGQPGWACLVPIYNAYILLKIAGRPGWWLILLFIPLVNIVIIFIVLLDIAKAFGRSVLFAILGLWLFTPIGILMLGFGKSQYIGVGNVAPQQPTVTVPSQSGQPTLPSQPVADPTQPTEPTQPVPQDPTNPVKQS
jgi:hypothetical protein